MMRGRHPAPMEVFGLFAAICGMVRNSVRFAGIRLAGPSPERLPTAGPGDEVREEGSGETLAARNAKARKVSCEECFFGKNGLCALALDEPCATFRPDHPEGLRPPSQLRFVFRQERRRQAAWAFPTAQEQAALHA